MFAAEPNPGCALLRFGAVYAGGLPGAPFAQLFPSLDQFLQSAGGGKGSVVNNAAAAVGLLVEIEYGTLVQMRQVAGKFVEMCPAQNVFPGLGIRTTRHTQSV